MAKGGSRGAGDMPPLGADVTVPVADRAPDPLVDSLATDGTQPAERNITRHPLPGGDR